MIKKGNGPEPATKEQEEEIKKKDLPPFRQRTAKKAPENKTEDQNQEKKEEFGPGLDEGEIAPDYLDDICGDILSTFFQLWHLWNPNVPALDEDRKKLMQPHMSKLAIKYKFTKVTKTEVIFFSLLGNEIIKRIVIKRPVKLEKKSVNNHSGKEGERQDEPSQEVSPS
ncbi:MAG: hypothetical protein HWN66_21210 [Candidatus Helarchaeota archaeon]|nr:hypothetical protein [Candidatus Helarchaeota archaeon]